MKAAIYESDITPPLGCYMSGSFKDRRIDGNLTVQKESLRIAKRKYDDEQFKEMVIKLANMGTKGRIGNLVYYHRTDKTGFADLYVQLITIGDLAIYIYPGEIFSQ